MCLQEEDMMGWLSALIERRTLRTWALVAIVGSLAMAAVLFVGIQSAQASHYGVTLEGSTFEIESDANLKLDGGLAFDWANVDQDGGADKPSGANDDSFGEGTKENTLNPTVVDGSIPPNKSDLKNFGLYQEGSTSSGFLNLFWSRVQDPQGTTNMDFELNQRECTPDLTPADPDCAGNNLTPRRSTGDILITYDLSNGGTIATISFRRWTANDVWGNPVNLAGNAVGTINTSPIPAGAASDNLGPFSPRTFGEAQVRLSALFTNSNTCQSFGSAYLKSRSSDAFNSAVKDFIAPVPVNISNCGSVKIIKTDDAETPLANAVFTLFKDNAPLNGPAPHGAEDTITTQKCTTLVNDDDGNPATPDRATCTITSVPFGQYWVVETTTPTGHTTAPDQNTIVSAANPTVTLTFVNPRSKGAILVTKTRKHAADGSGDHPQAGVDFTVNGVTKATDANGKACFDGLLFGDYKVQETLPAGYKGEADKTVAVNNAATCADSPYGGESISFKNMPLTDLSVSVDSQVDGGTASTIECTDAADASVASGTTGANGDGSASASDLEPGTYTCEVVIDP